MDTVLLVDEDVTARIIGETLLRTRGLQVHSTGDGLDALNYFTREGAAVVVLGLPAANGLELLRGLREVPTSEVPRVVIVTNSAEPEVERFAERLDADAFLRRPMPPTQFVATIEALVSASASWVAVATVS
ncbi:MAG: response regulator [Deltaproteobacteria bacterium]|nr:response regulator [Deltaproteobacteria bacterium]MBI3391252.1 response regulator [Deltaproteobacteria bacterium]